MRQTTLTTAQDGLAHLSSRRTRASIAGVAWTFLTVVLSSGLAISVFFITSRVLSPEDFGAVALAAAVVAIVSMLVPVAFGEAIIQRPDLKPAHLDTVFWISLGIAVAIFAGFVAFSDIAARLLGLDILTSILPVLALRIVFDAVSAVPLSLVARRMQFRYTALRSLLANAIGAAICIWLVLEGYALWALVISQIVNSAVSMVVSVLAARWRPGLEVTRQAMGELRFFGLYAMGGRLLNQARLDQFVLGLVLGAPMLGLFFFAQRLFTMLGDLTAGVFGPVTSVLMASLQSEPVKRCRAFHLASFASAGLAFPVFAGLIAVAHTAVPLLFGAQWSDAVYALQCFCVIGMLAGVGIAQSAVIRNLGRPDWWFWYQATVKLSALPLIAILHPFGLNTIMTALVLRSLLLWPLSVRQTRRMLDLPPMHSLRSIAHPALATAVMVPGVVLTDRMMPLAGDTALLATQVLVGAGLYVTVLVVTARRQVAEVVEIIRSRRAAA